MKINIYSALLVLLFLTFSCTKDDEIDIVCSSTNFELRDKIKGASILQTWIIAYESPFDLGNIITSIDLVEKTNSDWVALSPLISIFGVNNEPNRPYRFLVRAEISKMRTILPKIRASGLNNVMLKPLTSFEPINGLPFWGDFYANTEEEWLEIENALEDLIYEFAKLSLEYEEIKLLSIGNELSEFSRRRPHFFRQLIAKIRSDFPLLKLTYSANWDEYSHIDFWDDLDYIGVNPYFSLVYEKTPEVNTIEQSFIPYKEDLRRLSCEYEKPILFTEYGFRSMDYGLWEQWNLGEISQENINFKVQENGYSAFYNTFWDEAWVAGGFFWEWKITFPQHVNNPMENGWYVNDKPVEEIIKRRYGS